MRRHAARRHTRTAALLTAIVVAGPAAAQLLVNGPRGCDLVAGLSGDAVYQAIDDEHVLFDFYGLEAVEWHCAFEPGFDPYWETGEIQTRIGYCMEPGPWVTPGVFTLMDREDGTLQFDMSFADEPIIFEYCGEW